jgi:hypothetical protein
MKWERGLAGLLILCAAAAFVGTGCGGGDDDDAAENGDGDGGDGDGDQMGAASLTCVEFCDDVETACPETVGNECKSSCEGLSDFCIPETDAFMACATGAMDHDCDSDGFPGIPDSCATEADAMLTCLAPQIGAGGAR